MSYLLVVAALGDELRSREPPAEESQRTETLVRYGTRHVDSQESVWRSLKPGSLLKPPVRYVTERGGAKPISSAQAQFVHGLNTTSSFHNTAHGELLYTQF